MPMRNRLIRRRAFNKLEQRVFCPCELCRLRFKVMLYSKRGGEPIRSYRRRVFRRRVSEIPGQKQDNDNQ
jgi:hypothetical protein